MKTRGEALTIVLLCIVVLGGAAFGLSKTKWFNGESKRAEASKAATVKVEATTVKVDDAKEAQGSAAAAYVVEIGDANTTAPDSKEKQFIAAAVPISLSFLPSADPKKLLEAQQLKVAFLQGQLALANTLTDAALKDSAKLKQSLDRALTERDSAQQQRRQADATISEAAAANLALDQQRTGAIVIIVLLVGLYAYARIFSISPKSLGLIAADVRAGMPAIQAMNENLAPWLHKHVATAARQATELIQPIIKS